MENKTLKYIAAICFALIAVQDIVYVITDFYFLNLLPAVGSIFVVIALLTATPILSTVGFALWSIDVLLPFVGGQWILYNSTLFATQVMSLVLYILLMIAGIKPKSAKTLGLVAAILAVVKLVITIMGYGMIATYIFWGLLLAAGAMLLGLTYDSFSQKEVMNKAVAAQNSNIPAQGILEDNNVEKLMRLKAFLDEGVITQEEFDEKKKQLLGL